MKPWDPIIRAMPGGGLPVADPIRLVVPSDDEGQWWAHLLAALWGLRTVYHRMGDTSQVYRTGRVQERALEAVRRLYPEGEAGNMHRIAVVAASARVVAHDWRLDPLALETGWWAQAAACAHALAAGYAFAGGADDLRAVLACDMLREVRARVECALPPAIAHELLALATATAWSDSARVAPPSRGTPEPLPPPEGQTMETEG